jgi:hypothetical protein
VRWDDFYYWTFQSNGSFVLGGVQITTIALRGISAAVIFGALHFVTVRFAFAGGREALMRNLDLWIWVVTGLVAVGAGFRFYGHYWLQIVPPLALLAAAELRVQPDHVQLQARKIVGATAIAAFAVAWVPGVIRDLPDPEPLAEAVAELTDEDDTVLIWGNFPEIYWTAERAPAGGFVSMDFVTGRSGARDNGPHTIEEAPDRGYPHLLDAIEDQAPAVIVDTQPSEFRDYGEYPIALFPELEAFIAENYEAPILVDGFDLYRLQAS